MTSPRVLFLDEPTSGLDSFTANEVCSMTCANEDLYRFESHSTHARIELDALA